MLSIGEVARYAGVSRRMLRHWEDAGLLVPAATDPHTGYRRYARSQVGRVRAIAALRSVGFGLEAIADLLGARLTQERLVELLREREHALVTRIDEDSTRLVEVRQRLETIERGHQMITSAIELGPLPALRLAALQARVHDESEIGTALADLVPRLRRLLADHGTPEADVVLTYDGSEDGATITVTAGTAYVDGILGLDVVEVPGAERGATVRFDTPPADIGDAWISLDAHLEQRGWETTGVYRQLLVSGDTVVLQAPLVDVPRSAGTD